MGEFTCRPSASAWLLEPPNSSSRWVVWRAVNCQSWVEMLCVCVCVDCGPFTPADVRPARKGYSCRCWKSVFWHMLSGLCGGKRYQQLCPQRPVPDLFRLLPRPLRRRVSRSAPILQVKRHCLFCPFLIPMMPWRCSSGRLQIEQAHFKIRTLFFPALRKLSFRQQRDKVHSEWSAVTWEAFLLWVAFRETFPDSFIGWRVTSLVTDLETLRSKVTVWWHQSARLNIIR